MKKYFILAAAALMLGSCSNSSDEGGKAVTNPTDNTFRLKSTVAGSKAGSTRADGTDIQTSNIENGQSVFATFTTTLAAGDCANWSNATTTTGTYTADGSGNLTGASVKWPCTTAGTETVSITAWAPATAVPSTWSVKTDQTAKADYLASDLLYGTSSAITHDDIANPVTINFEHKLAKINVKIAGGSKAGGTELATSDLTNATIVFAEGTNVATPVAYLVTDATIAGSTVTKGSTKSAITVTTAYNATEFASAVIIPQVIEAASTTDADKKILFSVTLPGDLSKTYQYKIAANKEFKAGYEYTYNITIRGDQNTIILTEQIAKWTDGGNEAIIAQ